MLYKLCREFEKTPRLQSCWTAIFYDLCIYVFVMVHRARIHDDNTIQPLYFVLCCHHHHLCQKSASLLRHMLLLNPATTLLFGKLVIPKSVSDIAAFDRKDIHCVACWIIPNSHKRSGSRASTCPGGLWDKTGC